MSETTTRSAPPPARSNTSPLNDIESHGYARSDLLVSTTWQASHQDDAHLRVLESSEHVLLCDVGHIPNAQLIDWHADLNLLGHPNVTNYDGGRTEWGNSVRLPIERSAPPRYA